VVVPASPVNGEAALRAALHDRLGPALANLAMRLEVVEAAVADAALRAQFGGAGRARARDVFSLEAMMRQLDAAYAAALARAAARSVGRQAA